MIDAAHAQARTLIGDEMALFFYAKANYEIDVAWRALERAHILSQPYLWLHFANHWAMLVFAFDQRDAKEVIGQLARLALAPLGSLTGRIPTGNTGRSNVSAFQPMPIPEDLLTKIKGAPE